MKFDRKYCTPCQFQHCSWIPSTFETNSRKPFIVNQYKPMQTYSLSQPMGCMGFSVVIVIAPYKLIHWIPYSPLVVIKKSQSQARLVHSPLKKTDYSRVVFNNFEEIGRFQTELWLSCLECMLTIRYLMTVYSDHNFWIYLDLKRSTWGIWTHTIICLLEEAPEHALECV